MAVSLETSIEIGGKESVSPHLDGFAHSPEAGMVRGHLLSPLRENLPSCPQEGQ